MSRLTLEREFECRPRRKLVLDWPAMTGTRTLRSNEPLAVELTAALKQGEVDRLRRLLAANPGLAHCVVENAKGGGRTPLHLFADWSGHNSNAVEIVARSLRLGRALAQAITIRWRWPAACSPRANASTVLFFSKCELPHIPRLIPEQYCKYRRAVMWGNGA